MEPTEFQRTFDLEAKLCMATFGLPFLRGVDQLGNGHRASLEGDLVRVEVAVLFSEEGFVEYASSRPHPFERWASGKLAVLRLLWRSVGGGNGCWSAVGGNKAFKGVVGGYSAATAKEVEQGALSGPFTSAEVTSYIWAVTSGWLQLGSQSFRRTRCARWMTLAGVL
eukprot:325930-Amphidinium_carterae.1